MDLDTWTDEQMASMLKWGNARANKLVISRQLKEIQADETRYWEAKLAPGHVPAEAKIENFIRTKYESKRWVMEGPMPDPSTLDVEGEDDNMVCNMFQIAALLSNISLAFECRSREEQD